MVDASLQKRVEELEKTLRLLRGGPVPEFVERGVKSLETGWIKPNFLNGWVDYGSGWATAAYRRTASGLVILRGLVKNGTVGTAIFNVPVGFRIAENSHHVTCCAAGHGEVNIVSDGNVAHRGATNSWFSLDGICFMANIAI